LKRILTLTASFIIAATTAYAGNVESLGIGAKETAQGKAVAAQADTPFAAYYNPAGLTQIKQPTLTAGAIVYDAQVYSDNFKLTATTDGTGPYASTKKGDVISNGWDTDNETDDDPLVVPNLGYAMPINNKISFGIAAYAPYGLHIESNHNPYDNPLSFYAWESLYARTAVTPTLAYKINEKLSIGFGVSLGQSQSDAGKTYRYNPFVMAAASNTDFQTSLGTAVAQVAAGVPGGANVTDAATITNSIAVTAITSTDSKNGSLNELKLESKDDFNTSWNAGIMYKPTEKISLGLTYRSRAMGDFEGDVFFKGTKIGTVTMNYDHPEQVQGGIRYAVSKSLSVEFDMTWTNWSINNRQVEKMDLDQLSSTTGDAMTALAAGINANTTLSATEKSALITALASQDLTPGSMTLVSSHDRNWDNTIQYQLGAEWLVNDKLSLRGGVVYDPTPIPENTFDQGWPDTDRTLFNIGAGYNITEKLAIDGVFQYVVSTPSRDINGNSDELNNGFNHDQTAGLSVLGAPETEVSIDNDKGILYGLGLNLTYKF